MPGCLDMGAGSIDLKIQVSGVDLRIGTSVV
jgi:hypothetical protein